MVSGDIPRTAPISRPLQPASRSVGQLTVGTKMGANEVLEALYPLLLKRGQPAYLRSDNGP